MSLTPRNRQEEWYQEMIDSIGAGGSGSLPDTSTAYAGDVLSLNNSKEPIWTSQSGGGVLKVNVLADTILRGTLPNMDGYAWRSASSGSSDITFYVDVNATIDDVNNISVTIDGNGVGVTSYSNGVLSIAVGSEGKSIAVGYTDESQIVGKELLVTGLPYLDKTWSEIDSAGFAVIKRDGYVYSLSACDYMEGIYVVLFNNYDAPESQLVFTTDSSNGYPIMHTTDSSNGLAEQDYEQQVDGSSLRP